MKNFYLLYQSFLEITHQVEEQSGNKAFTQQVAEQLESFLRFFPHFNAEKFKRQMAVTIGVFDKILLVVLFRRIEILKRHDFNCELLSL